MRAQLKKIAMRLPGTEEDVACKGTALESAVFKAGKKSFLFVGPKQARLKLGPSVSEAKKLAAKKRGSCEVGAIGWVVVNLGPDAPPIDVLERWIAESHALMAGAAAPKAKASGSSRKR
jgi:hypothetical protein